MLESSRRERIMALDLLRGYFLAVMIIDHLVFFPSLFELFSGRGMLWASAAEGFFIISGILVGYVFGPRMASGSLNATKKMWRRTAQLYIWAVLLTWLFVWWGHLAGKAFIKPGLWINPPIGEFLYKTLTLQYSYGWADFLQYYVLFMALSPPILYLCMKGRARLVLAGSALVWCLRGSNFDLAWQLLFISGVVTGYYLPAIEQKARSFAPIVQRNAVWVLYASALIVVAVSALAVRGSEPFINRFGINNPAFPNIVNETVIVFDRLHNITKPLVEKWTLAPLRLATAALWFTALYVFVRRHERLVNRATFGVVKTLGEHSLFVYGLHSVVIFLALVVFPRSIGVVLNTLGTAAVLFLIYLITHYRHKKIQVRKQLQARAAAPKRFITQNTWEGTNG